jgi:PKD repeat protein
MVGVVNADTFIIMNSIIANDGYVSEDTDSNWQTIRDAAGDAYLNTAAITYAEVRLESSTTSGEYTTNRRGVVFLNASDIPDDAVLDSAIFGVYGISKNAGLGSPNLSLVGFTGTPGVAATQYNNFDVTPYSDDITYQNYNSAGYNNFTLNAAGLANISYTGTGFTNFMLMNEWDRTNNPYNLTWSSGTTTQYQYRDRSGTFTLNMSFLEVTYHIPSGESAPVASFTCTKNFLRIPNSVVCTDTSTNTPTSWSWNMGDGSSAITTQNVTYPFMKRGFWGITLNATNAGGSNVTASTNVKVVGYENNW